MSTRIKAQCSCACLPCTNRTHATVCRRAGYLQIATCTHGLFTQRSPISRTNRGAGRGANLVPTVLLSACTPTHTLSSVQPPRGCNHHTIHTFGKTLTPSTSNCLQTLATLTTTTTVTGSSSPVKHSAGVLCLTDQQYTGPGSVHRHSTPGGCLRSPTQHHSGQQEPASSLSSGLRGAADCSPPLAEAPSALLLPTRPPQPSSVGS